MAIKIIETTDTALLAKLNKDVQEIHHDIEPEIFKPYDHKRMEMLFNEVLEDDNTRAYIACYNDDVAGYMLLNKKHQRDNHFRKGYDVLHIDQICVEKDFKGKGIGKALVDFAKAYARSLDVSRLEMNYWTKNSNSGEFFRHEGFENYNERLAIKI